MSKTVLITGASTGFGRDTAETLADNGHIVFASMRDPSGKNRLHAKALEAKGIHTLALDVTDDNSVREAIHSVQDKAGQLDVLINNAGVASAGVTEAFSAQQVTALFDVNVIGLHRFSRAALPMMRKQQSGLIINIGSILGRVTFPFFGVYGASKYAVEALSDSLRYEVSQLDIDVALVQPSAYPTQMYDSAIQPEDTNCVTDYGEIGQIPNGMFEQFMAMFQSDNAPDPHDVAKAIAQLIDTPDGQRPARIVVGNSFGTDAINDAVKPVQEGTVKALRLEHLSSLKTNP